MEMIDPSLMVAAAAAAAAAQIISFLAYNWA